MKKLGWVLLVGAFLLLIFAPEWTESAKVDELKLKAEQKGWKTKSYEKKFRLGLHGHSKSMPKQAIAKFKISRDIPTSFDWRTTNMVTPPRDQGNCGSCWAFSSIGAIESIYKIKTGVTTDWDMSEQILVSCNSQNSGCDGGYVDGIANFLRDTGTAEESCFPYTSGTTGQSGNCSGVCPTWTGLPYKITSWGYVTSVNPDIGSIKAALVTYGPLPTTMNVYSDFMNYSSGIYRYVSGTPEGGHAILIVGYDDAGQYFIVKNSWGASWGEGGYFRIGYDQLNSPVLFGEETLYYTVDNTPPSPPSPPLPNPPSPGCSCSKGAKSGENSIKWFRK